MERDGELLGELAREPWRRRVRARPDVVQLENADELLAGHQRLQDARLAARVARVGLDDRVTPAQRLELGQVVRRHAGLADCTRRGVGLADGEGPHFAGIVTRGQDTDAAAADQAPHRRQDLAQHDRLVHRLERATGDRLHRRQGVELAGEALGHGIERGGELLELVVAVDHHRVREVALRDPASPLAQLLERPQRTPDLRHRRQQDHPQGDQHE